MGRRAAEPPPPRTTILIVEDHADTRDAMGMVVTLLGYHAILAESGAEALTILHRTRPDLVFCDIRMPGMDGLDFLRAVRRLPGGVGLNLIALTGVSDHATAMRYSRPGSTAISSSLST